MAEKLIIPTRDDLIANYERDYRLRLPDARVGEGTLPGIDARLLADQELPLYAEASRMADDATLENKTLEELRVVAVELGLPDLLPAVGSSGEVTAVASVGGATVLAGTLALHEPTGFRYQCTTTALYNNGDRIPVAAVDTGPSTDLPVGATLKWQSPPSGLGQNALVAADSQGNGLTGGRAAEGRTEIQLRISNELANPAVAGNSAEYMKRATETLGVAVQQPFAFSCINGPGTIGLAFTLRPTSSGGNRIPNNTQIAAVKANVIGQMPADDSLFALTVLQEQATLVYRIRWRPGTVGWKDPVPWPQYQASRVFVSASPTPTPTSCRFTTAGTPGNPQVGQTVAMFNLAAQKFVAKRIKTVSGAGPWDVTFETANAASDTTYTPIAGDIVCPWSDLMNDVCQPTIDAFDLLGPGEQVASSWDVGGQRQRRDPKSPAQWPSELTGRITIPIYALSSVDEVQVPFPSLPAATTVGTVGVSVYLKTLQWLAVYPL